MAEDDAFALVTADLPPATVEEYRNALKAMIQNVRCHPLALTWMRDMLRKDASFHPPRRLRKTIARFAGRSWYLEPSEGHSIFPSRRAASFFAAFQQCEARLAPATRNVLHILAQTFRDTPFAESDAIALFRPHQILQDLDALMDAGLLAWSVQEQGRYHFHPVLVAYASLVADQPSGDEVVDPWSHAFRAEPHAEPPEPLQ